MENEAFAKAEELGFFLLLRLCCSIALAALYASELEVFKCM